MASTLGVLARPANKPRAPARRLSCVRASGPRRGSIHLAPLRRILVGVRSHLAPLRRILAGVRSHLAPLRRILAGVRSHLAPLRRILVRFRSDLTALRRVLARGHLLLLSTRDHALTLVLAARSVPPAGNARAPSLRLVRRGYITPGERRPQRRRSAAKRGGPDRAPRRREPAAPTRSDYPGSSASAVDEHRLTRGR